MGMIYSNQLGYQTINWKFATCKFDMDCLKMHPFNANIKVSKTFYIYILCVCIFDSISAIGKNCKRTRNFAQCFYTITNNNRQ